MNLLIINWIRFYQNSQMLIPDPKNDENSDPSEQVFVVSLIPESNPAGCDSRSRGGDPLSRPFLCTAI